MVTICDKCKNVLRDGWDGIIWRSCKLFKIDNSLIKIDLQTGESYLVDNEKYNYTHFCEDIYPPNTSMLSKWFNTVKPIEHISGYYKNCNLINKDGNCKHYDPILQRQNIKTDTTIPANKI
jgi:hypothetical protein